MVVDSVLVSAILGFAMVLLGLDPAAVLVAAAAAFAVSLLAHLRYGRGRIRDLQAAYRPVFTSPPSA
jgi:sterol desaturase/sphingolipid hydroxylase (fatty acid hydroxylase superfamily)